MASAAAMEVLVQHPAGCEGGPTKLSFDDGSTTVGAVVAAFKEKTGVAFAVRLRAGGSKLRATSTLAEAGVVSGQTLSADRNTTVTPVTQALRRLERGVTQQSRSHRDLMVKLDGTEGQQNRAVDGLHTHLDEQHATAGEKLDGIAGKLDTILGRLNGGDTAPQQTAQDGCSFILTRGPRRGAALQQAQLQGPCGPQQ